MEDILEMGEKTPLHTRIEGYYDCWKLKLPRRMPICIRCDGKGFSKLTSGCNKPYDADIAHAMEAATIELCKQSGASVGFTQSDEITVAMFPYKKYTTEPWFGGSVEKLCSVAASIVAVAFCYYFDGSSTIDKTKVAFDARVGVFPRHEVRNVFLDRQRDGRRNAIQGIAMELFGKKTIFGWDTRKMLEEIRKFLANGVTFSREELSSRVDRTPKDRAWLYATANLINNDQYMNGRMVVPQLYEVDGATRQRWVVEAAPNFSESTTWFDKMVWPEGEEGVE